MDKAIYQSKTLWGFGLAALVAVAQIFKVLDASVVTELVKVLGSLFGVYGLRSALD